MYVTFILNFSFYYCFLLSIFSGLFDFFVTLYLPFLLVNDFYFSMFSLFLEMYVLCVSILNMQLPAEILFKAVFKNQLIIQDDRTPY